MHICKQRTFTQIMNLTHDGVCTDVHMIGVTYAHIHMMEAGTHGNMMEAGIHMHKE